MNKITGLVLFLLPLTLPFAELKYSSIAVCSIATFAAIQEGFYIAKSKDNDKKEIMKASATHRQDMAYKTTRQDR